MMGKQHRILGNKKDCCRHKIQYKGWKVKLRKILRK